MASKHDRRARVLGSGSSLKKSVALSLSPQHTRLSPPSAAIGCVPPVTNAPEDIFSDEEVDPLDGIDVAMLNKTVLLPKVRACVRAFVRVMCVLFV
jgi:hypothetical protein